MTTLRESVMVVEGSPGKSRLCRMGWVLDMLPNSPSTCSISFGMSAQFPPIGTALILSITRGLLLVAVWFNTMSCVPSISFWNRSHAKYRKIP